MLQNGDIIGGIYQVVREIGKGGAGIIYLGYHLHLRKPIIIKKVKEHYVGCVNIRAEADILKKLHHRYLPQVYDFREAGNGIYTVMDYIPGENLQYYLEHNYTFPEKTLIMWMRQLCEVLEYLHTRQPAILHSDIKPANIMVTPDGDICLIDFNISLDGITVQEVQGISRSYAAPEQFRCAMDKLHGRKSKEILDVRMDIYSLGAVFYHMMSGWRPDAETGIPYVLSELDIPYRKAFQKIVEKAMEWDPSKRFKSADAMAEALNRIEKYDPLYRRLTRLQMYIGIVWGVILLAGSFSIAGGIGQRSKELWREAYGRFYAVTVQGDSATIIGEGTSVLNDALLQSYMKKNPEQKAEVLHAVGDAYFYQEQYTDAARYYKEAVECDGTDALYLRDYMVALVRDGRIVDQEFLRVQYPKADLDEAATIFVQAQAAYTAGDYEKALSECKTALEKSYDSELSTNIWEFQSEIYTAWGNLPAAADAAAKAAERDSSADVLRRAAKTAYEAASEERTIAEKNVWYEDALGYYERLSEKENPAYEDRLNRALVLRVLGRYQDSIDVLRMLHLDYPEDYKIQMWMCYNYLDRANKDRTYETVISDLNFAYNSCKKLYEDRENRLEDDDMESLKSVMEQLMKKN